MATLAGATVLVTGGAGFIGSHLVDALVGDNAVRVLDDLSAGDRQRLPDAAALVEGDVRDPATVREAAAGADVVFHEAALVNVERSVEDPGESQAVNVGGTLNVLEAARETGARVVLASSAAIYGRPERLPVAEDDPKRPRSPYGLDKLAADHYARLYHELYGVETVALRYFNVYGPRQTGGPYSGVIGIFTRQALSGEPVSVHGDGTQTRDFVHVDDVVRANLAAATADAAGVAVNVATGASVTVRELAERIVELAGSDSAITHVEPREGDVDRSRADVSRAAEVLGYAPSVELDDGLADYIEWYRAAGGFD
ncbi:MAG: NAD-dependent epimerase/dehydratase family protein [Halobacteriales archaeon]